MSLNPHEPIAKVKAAAVLGELSPLVVQGESINIPFTMKIKLQKGKKP